MSVARHDAYSLCEGELTSHYFEVENDQKWWTRTMLRGILRVFNEVISTDIGIATQTRWQMEILKPGIGSLVNYPGVFEIEVPMSVCLRSPTPITS
ncbi:hypothetical protein M378DRAFT_678038 [Amanita muscaria Koide BX008]|uniref:Uncharacterized protein n=1 Tax=Amanita muscaria (strain Koide BX008) TaxID=946122 RepID=A0A0C2W155_AMAMK|nr:hypothetical protein M378DRAFT_678038 [Amanita muscaria Koide BX008]